ncbi:unnamed protein product [Caenorhabditis brenneri]
MIQRNQQTSDTQNDSLTSWLISEFLASNVSRYSFQICIQEMLIIMQVKIGIDCSKKSRKKTIFKKSDKAIYKTKASL